MVSEVFKSHLNVVSTVKTATIFGAGSELILQNLPYVDSTKSDKGFTKETVVVGPPQCDQTLNLKAAKIIAKVSQKVAKACYT